MWPPEMDFERMPLVRYFTVSVKCCYSNLFVDICYGDVAVIIIIIIIIIIFIQFSNKESG